jgi:hypothetical protein
MDPVNPRNILELLILQNPLLNLMNLHTMLSLVTLPTIERSELCNNEPVRDEQNHISQEFERSKETKLCSKKTLKSV